MRSGTNCIINSGQVYSWSLQLLLDAKLVKDRGRKCTTAIVLSSVMMLEHLHEAEAATRVRSALFRVYREGQHLTRDIVGGQATTREFTDAVIAAIDR